MSPIFLCQLGGQEGGLVARGDFLSCTGSSILKFGDQIMPVDLYTRGVGLGSSDKWSSPIMICKV